MTYLDYDVLTINPNRTGGIEETLRRRATLLDNRTGRKTSDEHSAAPAPARPVTWTALGRAEIAELRAFLDARKGRAVPFWLPSYQWDLTLAEDVLEDAATLTIRWMRYRQQMWGTTGARRHVALWTLGIGTMDCYRISDATDPGDSLTETLAIAPVAVRAYPATQTVVSFLKLCRLEDDLVEISHPAAHVAEATIRIRDLPLEAPTA